MKKTVQIFIVLIMVAVSYNSSACNITPLIIPNGSTSICQGSNVTLSTDSAYVSYLWSDGETTQSIYVTTAGSYSVYVTNSSGCNGTSAITVVIVNPLPTPTITTSGPTTFCTGGSVTLTSNTGVSYLWNTGATTQSIVDSGSGSFYVTVTDINGCTAFSPSNTTFNYTGASQTWTVPTGISSLTIAASGAAGGSSSPGNT